MNVHISTLNDFTVVEVHGRVDTISASEFETRLLAVIESGASKIVLNCQGLDYISSSGLRVFLIAQKKIVAAKGQLKLCCLQPTIKEIFDISGFSSIFSILADLDTATKT